MVKQLYSNLKKRILCSSEYRKSYFNIPEAIKWYQRAYEQGSTMACSRIAYFYLEGKGVPKDHKISFDYCIKGIKRGDMNAEVVLDSLAKKGFPAAKSCFDIYGKLKKDYINKL